MTSILVQDILDKSSVSESETSYLGKARLVHYHAGSSLEFDIPRYHYNFITGINILSVSDNVESVTIKINSFVKTLPKKCFFSESDIQTKKMNLLIIFQLKILLINLYLTINWNCNEHKKKI